MVSGPSVYEPDKSSAIALETLRCSRRCARRQSSPRPLGGAVDIRGRRRDSHAPPSLQFGSLEPFHETAVSHLTQLAHDRPRRELQATLVPVGPLGRRRLLRDPISAG